MIKLNLLNGYLLNLLIAFTLYIVYWMIDRLWLKDLHDDEHDWMIEFQKIPKVFEYFFYIITNVLFYPIVVINILMIFLLKDKRDGFLFLLCSAIESHMKKLLAIVFREERPGFMNQKIGEFYCNCLYGNPSGHMS